MRPTPLLLAALAVVAGAAGCGEEERAVPPVAIGVITDVEGEGGAVESFALETRDHGTLEVFIDPSVDYGFHLGHLNEHQASGGPVRCTLEERDGRAYALEILDV